ncbi:membrane-targeted effector domain-containing toxin [Pseudomonas sp. RC2C2]|uniref:membrane-targeted effector domain-containing toxin n=1 Tax=Pseudomonas sp. RC2C2 TaxID=2834408 RepID=UPI001BCFA104|nr:membrane-targeted effector domain-containing toxin [Pseudomonas sp. RC2C2]MBS7599654.1 membrane-targeted effector domain-containing toxin [Pseudomonas sp. RC2C2]
MEHLQSVDQSNLHLEAARASLRQLAETVVNAFPDLHASARLAAMQLLVTQTNQHGDPDKIYWNRFSHAASNDRSYTGWEHYGTPYQSWTLTELVMRRFRVSDQDNADLLQLYGGFYTEGPEARRFDESNEVRLDPQKVLNALWEMDFGAGFQRQRTAFWVEHGADVRALSKLNYLAQALQAGLGGHLNEQQLQLVFDAVGFDSSVAVHLQHFEQVQQPAAGIQLATLSLAGQVSSALVWLQGPGAQPQHVLYMPGAVPSFQAFSSQRELFEWLFGWLQVAASREQLLAYFSSAPQQVQGLRDQLASWAQGSVEAFAAQVQRAPINGEVFTWMRDNARQHMELETDAALRTNAELRAQLWVGYLGVASRLLGAVAPAGWPLALLAVAVGTASLALNIEQAVDGDNPEERRAGLLGAILAGVDLLLNLPFLLPLGRGAAQELGPLEGNVIIDVPAATSGPLQGVSSLADGAQYIELEGVPYRVRYDQALRTWLIVPEDNPFAFNGVIPVRLDEQGQWIVLESACLRGGGQCLGGLTPEPAVAMVDYSPFEAVPGRYEVPEPARPAVLELLSARNRRAIGGDYYDPESPLMEVRDSLEQIRQQLRTDAETFFTRITLPRFRIHPPAASISPQRAFIELFDEHAGVVIGESHASIASKRWLLENLTPMYAKGVRTLYLEHLMTDLHQADLDLFHRSGRMSAQLRRYLERLDVGHRTDPTGRYTFLELVRKARANRIRVQAVDCVASYQLEGLEVEQPFNPLRQKVMNYYANRVITARQAEPGAGKWVALVGNTHSNLYKRVPGLAELQGVPGLRLVDAGPGQATGITLDAGEYYLPSMGNPDGIVQGDLRLALQTQDQPVAFRDAITAPPGVIRPGE